MSEELKEAMTDLATGVKSLTDAVQEAKAQYDGQAPGDVQEKLVKIAEDVTLLSAAVKRIDEAPALKRAFDVEGIADTKRMSFETKAALPSNVAGNEDMAEVYDLQDAIEVLKFCKRYDSSFRLQNTKTWARLQKLVARKIGIVDAALTPPVAASTIGYDGTAGQAAEWIPTGWSPDLIMKFELERQVAALFTTINMPTDPFKFPRQTARARAYLKARMVNAKESASTTDDVTLSCQTIAAYSVVAYEVEEDAIIAMLPFIRQDLAQALADGEEDAIINGDTAGSHMDEDVTGDASDVRKAWDGLRKIARTSGSTYDLGAPVTDSLRALRALMGKYAVNPKRLAYITSPVGLIHLLGMEEVMTLEKYGPAATVLTGELGRFDGVPITVSGLMRENLSTTGVYDSDGNHAHTGTLLVNTNGFVIGRRRAPMIESFRDIVAGVDEIVASMREDFKSRYPDTEATVVYAYNTPSTITVGS
jgi:HK97 family phage major capsid protein